MMLGYYTNGVDLQFLKQSVKIMCEVLLIPLDLTLSVVPI